MENKDKSGLGIVSLICGIVGFWVFGIVLGIISIVTGILSWETKLGKVGFVIGVIDVVGVLVLFS